MNREVGHLLRKTYGYGHGQVVSGVSQRQREVVMEGRNLNPPVDLSFPLRSMASISPLVSAPTNTFRPTTLR